MLFNSLDFAVFLPIVFAIYWSLFTGSVRGRNIFLIATGCVFYGWWDWRFLGLWLFTAGVDYLVAMGMERSTEPRHRWTLMGLSLIANLGLLGFFKYFDFFLLSFTQAFTLFGHHIDARPLGIVLPVGISFYTFQSLSYTFDVYRRQLPAVKDPSVFFAFVSFFPQLLAGPIERARHMLPQFTLPTHFDHPQAVAGMEMMLWGFFKKVVIADNCARFVTVLFDEPQSHGLHGGLYALGCVLFAFQIYCDFSGYSDIAIGCARLFGFDLMRNFATPYFSRDIAEFWRRWHISLSTWFRDYVYLPLGGNRLGPGRTILNVSAVFLLSGLWHGANLTFIVWGAYHALLFLPLMLLARNRKFVDKISPSSMWPSGPDFVRMIVTFSLVCLGWVFFRAKSLSKAFEYLANMFSNWTSALPFDVSLIEEPNTLTVLTTCVLIGFLILVEWAARHRMETIGFRWPYKLHRWFQLLVVLVIMLYGEFNQSEFIYFQF
jgi:alginate O-acetyltransferase complex protein AlgI